MALDTWDIIILSVSGVLALLLGGIGLRRGPLAEGLVLVGLLLGALLMAEWGDVWGSDLAEIAAIGGDAGLTRFIVWAALLLVPVLLAYLGAVRLPALPPLRLWQRLLGGVLGALNGITLIAFLLRAWYYTVERGAGTLPRDPVANVLLNWAGWWPLGLLLLGSGVVLAGVLTGAYRPKRTTPPRVAPVPIKPSGATPGDQTTLVPIPMPAGPSLMGSPTPPPVRPAPPIEVLPTPVQLPPAPPAPPAHPDERVPVALPPQIGATGIMRCRTCGTVLPPGAAFCTNCGTPVEI